MSVPEPTTTLTSRLAALAQRLGLTGRAPRQILERASALRLPFNPLPPLRDSIWWQAGVPLQRLVELRRGALSGPVQEDKAQAHGMLVRLVEQHERTFASFDLRLIDGLGGDYANEPLHAHLEDYATAARCRAVRIISYKDFVRTISQPLPRFLAGEPIKLLQASWNGSRLYWAGEQHNEELAGAIVYARRRELEVTLPAQLTSYRLSPEGLEAFKANYHVLAMPVHAWSDPLFMGLLLDNGLPYARLSLLRTPGSPEFLLLPKDNPEAMALGEGLRLAGAPDVLLYLSSLR
ncbi:MAG: DUF6685 family protein [Pseudomonadota bacterium]